VLGISFLGYNSAFLLWNQSCTLSLIKSYISFLNPTSRVWILNKQYYVLYWGKCNPFFIIILVGKVRNIIGNTIEGFSTKDGSPFNSKVLQDLTNILPKQSTTIHGKKEDGRVMFHELLPHSSMGETFIRIGINTRNHDKLSNVACEYASTN